MGNKMLQAPLTHIGVFTRIGQSTLHGVGVFAIKAIPAGTELFTHDDAEIRWIDADAVEESRLCAAEHALYRDFAIRRDGLLGCPANFNLLTPGWFINRAPQGHRANVRVTEDFRMLAAGDIARGDELTLDYSTISRGSAVETAGQETRATSGAKAADCDGGARGVKVL